ncbi:hypothetical protein DCAR_0520316 [Daucus carota subsp. sativus]|uniref:THO1-MOS11 C-terminal domain-containing protein n=1 Tax=Daucus carota subsp. sativus TaxID=79200 RepID=A0AAF0X4E9_DAUCS|nr:PREDICTED: protein MODIFIER OF SNC1 11 [Daucus carota subsp. sativus]XP_017253649.1 PREDICTED: protein MODIFIER OF SNC1 11 [Daucus carota subsp. sativus]XP_017253650.1 PREDICTED: protein MODIFIER OF SNC1 11 [Daucus carota subsp. sativus]WOH00940.1 hypothetical protein DCAR_0520316 [Daucus carota subsp. sativus]
MAATTTTTTEEQTKHNLDKTLTEHEQSDPQAPQSIEASSNNTSPDAGVSAGDEELKVNSGDPAEINNGGEDSKAKDPAENNSSVALKKRRAERFGMPVQLSEQEKRNSRAERFGTGSGLPESDTVKKSEDNKRKARAERFGLEQSVPAAEDEKKKARLARFTPASKTDPVEEDKKKARALRFSETSASALHHNGKEIEPKTAISNKAVGGP